LGPLLTVIHCYRERSIKPQPFSRLADDGKARIELRVLPTSDSKKELRLRRKIFAV
jgi:hypothetical protein